MQSFPSHVDAWSSGQIGSKLWLCQELEKLPALENRPQTVWILGGWEGTLGFLMLARGKIPIEKLRSFDLDPESTRAANIHNELWVWRDWTFQAFCEDVNKIDYADHARWSSPPPTLIINTSTEHFPSRDWFSRIPKNTLLALQSNDLKLDDHVDPMHSMQELETAFPLAETLFKGELRFDYPNMSYTRRMLIGRR